MQFLSYVSSSVGSSSSLASSYMVKRSMSGVSSKSVGEPTSPAAVGDMAPSEIDAFSFSPVQSIRKAALQKCQQTDITLIKPFEIQLNFFHFISQTYCCCTLICLPLVGITCRSVIFTGCHVECPNVWMSLNTEGQLS